MKATKSEISRCGIALLAGATVIVAGCAEEPTALRETDRSREERETTSLESLLTCQVVVSAGEINCASAASSTDGGLQTNLIVGNQDQFVRLESDDESIESGTLRAQVTVQNLTFQPFGTADGSTPTGTGVRVFFVNAPNNGVVVANPDGTASFLGSAPKKYFKYGSELFGDDGILSQGEVSEPKLWEFTLNGAEVFQFSLLVSTTVPEPSASSVQMTRVAAPGKMEGRHTCGEGADGKLYCWGDNTYGQLGIGVTGDRSLIPVEVQAPAGVTLSNVGLGKTHTCAEGSNGNIYCWGNNTFGQLGDSTTTASNLPVAVKSPAGVTLSGLAVGSEFNCAQGSDNEVYCWGSGSRGALGDGNNKHRYTPTKVLSPEGVKLSGLTAGGAHACAEGSDGKTYCWGWSLYGQLGNNETFPDRWAPYEVMTPEDVSLTRLSAGYHHTCADGSDGKIYCWGYNTRQQSGVDGDTLPVLQPTAIPDAPGGVTLSRPVAGYVHTCAEGSDDNLYCWGRNTFSELGTTQLSDSVTATPIAVQARAGVKLKRAALGTSHTCAIDNGEAHCWGLNTRGQLGIASTSVRRYTPALVAGTRK